MPKLLSSTRRRYLLCLVAIGLAQAVLSAMVAALLRYGFDRLGAGDGQPPSGTMLLVTFGLVGCAIGTGLLKMAERLEAERLGQSYVHDVRLRLYDRLLHYPPRALQTRSHGGVMLRFVGDASALRQWVSLGLSRLIVSALATAGVLAALAMLNVALAAALATTMLAGAALSLSCSRHIRDASAEQRRRKANLAANLARQTTGLAVVQSHGQTARERKHLARQSRRLRDAAVARTRAAGGVQGVVEATTVASVAVTIGVGQLEIGVGRATPGTVVAAVAIVGIIAPALRGLGRVEEYRRTAAVAAARIDEFLASGALLREQPEAPELADGPGRLELRQVTVDPGLVHVSAVAKAGSRVALIGANGSGKSTLLSVACGLIEPDAGCVLLDGQNLASCTHASVRWAIGVAGPQFPLLRGTVGENLRYRWPDAPEGEAARIRELCGIDELLSALPNGADTRVADFGANLSAGQRQRIALARALLGDPRLLLLDEADAHLDSGAAGAIDRILATFPGTVIIVTHRPERLAQVDVVWQLEAGRLAKCGPPREFAGGAHPGGARRDRHAS